MQYRDYDVDFAAGQDIIVPGRLRLPSGLVTACDPYFCASAMSFTRQVQPGAYEVQLRQVSAGDFGPRIALARIVFAAGVPAATYELALTTAADDAGYIVESGVGCFMDESTRSAFAHELQEHYRLYPRGNYYTDVLAAEFKKNAARPHDPDDTGRWVLFDVPKTTWNIAMFSSGLGDGCFASYWGLSATGDVTSLVTDFGIMPQSDSS